MLAEFFVSVFLFPYSAKAANLNFSQSILPVRFVYLGKNNEIEKIWSNVSEKDSIYVIKFFNDKRGEVSINERALISYQETVKREQTSMSALPNGQAGSRQGSALANVAVDFLKTGGILEEVRTYC